MTFFEPRTGDLERLGGTVPPGSRELSVWAIPLRWDDGRAIELLNPHQRGFSAVGKLHWLRQGWLPVASLKHAFAFIDQDGNEVATESRVAVELVTGQQIGVPPSERPLKLVPRTSCNILPRWSPDEIAAEIETDWMKLLSADTPEAIDGFKKNLAARGVPPFAETLTVAAESPFLMPVYIGLVDTAAGEEVQVIDGITINLHPHLSFLLTDHLDELKNEFLGGRRVRGVDET
ncbi:MAG TPA: hypothetical protein VFH56_02985 [Acidimicrobiales bacterium]|nr:hypothetical protein [Acidimicrobiales bacterium]